MPTIEREEADTINAIIEDLMGGVHFQNWLAMFMEETGYTPEDLLQAANALSRASGMDPFISPEDF